MSPPQPTHPCLPTAHPPAQYVLRCRRRLDPRFRMAAELRCRGWLADPAWRARLVEALAAQGVTIVSADELEHETAQKDREQRGLPPGASCCCSACCPTPPALRRMHATRLGGCRQLRM